MARNARMRRVGLDLSSGVRSNHPGHDRKMLLYQRSDTGCWDANDWTSPCSVKEPVAEQAELMQKTCCINTCNVTSRHRGNDPGARDGTTTRSLC